MKERRNGKVVYIRKDGTFKGGEMNVPYDKWGEWTSIKSAGNIYDENGEIVGNSYIEDEYRWTQVNIIQSATLRQVLKDVEAWKNDDDTYGGEDESIYIAYADGSYITNDMEDFGKRFKKNRRQIIGASISTADYEAVAGDEIDNRGNYTALKTWSPDGESGYANAMSGYVSVETWKERVKRTFYDREYAKAHGLQTRQAEVIRRSDKKPIEIKPYSGWGKIIAVLDDE